MKVNLTALVRTMAGAPFKTSEGADLTLYDVFYAALSGWYPAHETVGGPVKKERYLLAYQMYTVRTGELELNRDQLELLRTLVGFNAGPFVFGAVDIMIDQILAGKVMIQPKLVN